MNLVDTLDAYSKGVALHPQTLNRRVSGCGAESVRIRAKQLVNAAPLNIHWAFPLFFSPQVFKCKIAARGLLRGIISSHLISTRDINHKQKVATHIRARSTCPLMGLDGRVRARAGHHVFAHPFSSFFFFIGLYTRIGLSDFLAPTCQDHLLSLLSFFCRNNMKGVRPSHPPPPPPTTAVPAQKMTNGAPRWRLSPSTPALKRYCVCAWISFKMTYSIDLCALCWC